MNQPRVISEERFLDAGEQDANGLYDYYYSGLIVVVEASDVRFKIYLYDDEPGVATFKTVSTADWAKVAVDLADPAFRSAVELLVDQYRIKAVNLYDASAGVFDTHDVATLFESKDGV